MTTKKLMGRISTSPDAGHGKAGITETRVMVSVVLDALAEGSSVNQVLQEYPLLSRDNVLAAIEHASLLAREKILPVS